MSEPGWLQRIIPWWLLRFVNRHTNTCWAHMVMWKMYGDDWSSWRIAASCWGGREGQEYDYCGRYQDKESFDKASKKEE